MKTINIDGIKVCQECEHRREGVMIENVCIRNIIITRNPVTGELEQRNGLPCEDERRKRLFSLRKRCGPEGKFFEPKNPKSKP